MADNSYRDDPEYLRRRRQIIRENHPDHGGSDDALIAALADLDAEWDRRSRPGLRAADIPLPGFIPEDVARQAADMADQYTDEVMRRARRVVETQTPRLRRIRTTAERRASSVVRSVQEHLPRNFPGARRYTDTQTSRTEKQ
ncbi:hypothetical protein [Corynebacterium terpenotabidum]|uniref:Uncharacterized protein n=1 Tax=Corynebacterium terpenotabidum Y-11 TaxID=1200352 RepID=S4XLX1_9CORY|nr:hypothetical protein [Corynebacterium terpenotabidum]AGP31613.1 hypothetical protein A606_09870 [Corynebacterium terpenotabidum Y-11]